MSRSQSGKGYLPVGSGSHITRTEEEEEGGGKSEARGAPQRPRKPERLQSCGWPGNGPQSQGGPPPGRLPPEPREPPLGPWKASSELPDPRSEPEESSPRQPTSPTGAQMAPQELPSVPSSVEAGPPPPAPLEPLSVLSSVPPAEPLCSLPLIGLVMPRAVSLQATFQGSPVGRRR